MQEAINSILLSLHKFLYPAREEIFTIGLIYLIISSFYYQWRRSKIAVSQKHVVRNAILHSGLAAFIASYGATLEIQDQFFLEHLFVFLPICSLLIPSLLVLFLWIGYYFRLKSNNDRIEDKR